MRKKYIEKSDFQRIIVQIPEHASIWSPIYWKRIRFIFRSHFYFRNKKKENREEKKSSSLLKYPPTVRDSISKINEERKKIIEIKILWNGAISKTHCHNLSLTQVINRSGRKSHSPILIVKA